MQSFALLSGYFIGIKLVDLLGVVSEWFSKKIEKPLNLASRFRFLGLGNLDLEHAARHDVVLWLDRGKLSQLFMLDGK